ncbi:MAG: isoaspartyl peptidase/L-asparaginase, partial [Flavobacteriales bacterium]|nr:isoaspartyl peptidase/L-asparaginase [Flavobacteriales bacterium]
MGKTALAIHGGAGTISRSQMPAEKEAAYRKALEDALSVGIAILENGGHALDAVEAAVMSLEDCPLFNAGRGAVFTHDGRHEMDASLMRGDTLQAGAVAGISGVRHPVQLARRVMENTGHVLLSGAGAVAFAREEGLEFQPDDWFFSEFRHAQWQEALRDDVVRLDHSGEKKFGTVGAVAIDQNGNLAAATSTGGMTNKKWGRVGDTPIIGAGTYADNQVCAISCTGNGEYFIRAVAAYDVACL